MTVKELINKLNQLEDKNAEIVILDDNEDEYKIQEEIPYTIQYHMKPYYLLKTE